MNEQIKALRQKGVLIAAHRGMAAGNIPCNTLPAFEAALRQGAHIIETDITLSRDGVPFIFHPKQEINHLNKDIHLDRMTAPEISQERYVNGDNALTFCPVVTLDAALETLKNRCLINLDHAWHYLPQVVEAVRRHKMEEQIILKTPAKDNFLEQMEALAPDILFMPIVKQEDNLTEKIEKMNLNFGAIEVVFKDENSYLASEAYIDAHHQKGRLVWVNSILYDSTVELSGGHNDDVAVTQDPDRGWGWLVERGFDIIQTDWIAALSQYLAASK